MLLAGSLLPHEASRPAIIKAANGGALILNAKRFKAAPTLCLQSIERAAAPVSEIFKRSALEWSVTKLTAGGPKGRTQ